MKKLLAILAFALALPAFGQLNNTTPANVTESYGQGVYSAPTYNYVTRITGGGSTGTGAYSIQVGNGAITLADGRRVQLFANTIIPPITVGSGTLQETVTPSATSGCTGINTPIALQTLSPCTLTATFSNAHGVGELVQSGDLGIQEALNDASNNGGGLVYWQVDTNITLATGATTTDTAFPYEVPNQVFNIGAAARVTTTITSACTGWEVGTAATVTRFTSNNTGLTAGTTAVATLTASSIAGTTTGLTPIRITCAGGNPGAGALHVKLWGYAVAQPAF